MLQLPVAERIPEHAGARGGKAIRIAYVCMDPRGPFFGRQDDAMRMEQLVRALMAHGARIELFVVGDNGTPPIGLEDVPVHRLSAASGSGLSAAEQEALARHWHLQAAIEADSTTSDDMARILTVSRHLRAAVAGGSADQDDATQFLAVNQQLRAALEEAGSFDLVYERYSRWSFAGMEHARACGTPGLLEVDASFINRRTESDDSGRCGAHEWMADQIFHSASALITVSEGTAAYLQRYAAARGRVHVVPNGVNPRRFPAGLVPSFPASPGTFTVGFVGDLKPWSGLPILAEAFALLHRKDPATRLLIVGDGPQRDDLVDLLSARGVSDAVRLTRAVPPIEIPGLLASMDVAVAPYPNQSYSSFSLLKVYEYMAAGVPVVASRISQLTRMIQDGTNGLLCQPGDPVALAEALDRVRLDPDARSRIGQAGRSTVLRAHTWHVVADRILQLADVAVAPQTARAEMRP